MNDKVTQLPAKAEPEEQRLPAIDYTPRNLADLREYCQEIAKTELVPKEYRGRPADIMVCIQYGAEVGLKPLQALKGVAVINGKASIWGDALIGLVQGSPLCDYVHEEVTGEGDGRMAVCQVKRRGRPAQTRTFSVADAKKAGLWEKTGPWKQYPERMLQMRARGFACRDVFSDVLGGLSMAEEVRDYIDVTPERVDEPTTVQVPEGTVERAKARLKEARQKEEAGKQEVADFFEGTEKEQTGEISPFERALQLIAEAKSRSDLDACAAAVNALTDPGQKRQAGKALAEKARAL